MTGNGWNPTCKICDDWGIVYCCLTHMKFPSSRQLTCQLVIERMLQTMIGCDYDWNGSNKLVTYLAYFGITEFLRSVPLLLERDHQSFSDFQIVNYMA